VVLIAKDFNLILGRSLISSGSHKGETIHRAISIYCRSNIDFNYIEADAHLFKFDASQPESINDNESWVEIRNIFSSFILSNFKMSYSKQFYKFPWWIPKKRYHYDFPMPDWLIKGTSFNPLEHLADDHVKTLQNKNLIPESYLKLPILIGDKQNISFPKGNISYGPGFFRIEQKRFPEMSYNEIELGIPSKEYQILKNSFKLYSNKNNPINFHSNQFLSIR